MADADVPGATLASVAGADFVKTIEALGFGVGLLDSGLRFVDVSSRLSELFGLTPDEVRAVDDPAQLVTAHSRHRVAGRRSSLADRHPGVELDEVTLLTGDGRQIEAQVASAAVELPGSDIGTGLLVILRDLRPTLAMDESLAQLTSLAELMPVGLVVLDARGVTDPLSLRVAAVNASVGRMLSVDLDGAVGQPIVALLPEVDRIAAARLLALAGTDRVEHFGDARYRDVRFRWQAAGLPGPSIGVIFEDVSRERSADWERRRLLERLVDTGDDERRRLAVAMHDDPVQKIAAATLLVEALRRHPEATLPSERLETIEATLRSAMATLRQLTFELSPPELVESGLEAALRSAGAYLFDGTAVRAAVDVDLRQEPAGAIQTAAFRIVAEALSNVRKHAEASAVSVRIDDHDGILSISVSDDGHGMGDGDPQQPGHLGLRSMHERARAVGGSLDVVTSSHGVTIDAQLPLQSRVQASPPPVTIVDAAHGGSDHLIVRRERDSLRQAIGAALDRARVAEGRLRDAFDITKAIMKPGLSRTAISTIAAEHLGRAMRDGCAVHLTERDGLRTAAAWHVDPSQVAAVGAALFEVGADGGHVGTALRSGAGVLLDDVALEAAARAIDLAAAPPHSAIVAPLTLDGDTLGVVTLARGGTRVAFGQDDLDFLMCLVDRVAVALSLAEPAPA